MYGKKGFSNGKFNCIFDKLKHMRVMGKMSNFKKRTNFVYLV